MYTVWPESSKYFHFLMVLIYLIKKNIAKTNVLFGFLLKKNCKLTISKVYYMKLMNKICGMKSLFTCWS